MTTALDPRFAKVVAQMKSTTHVGERQSAKALAQTMAAKAGMTLDQAIQASGQPVAKTVTPNIFAGFDDWMEEREPGYKTKLAVERAERERLRLERVAALVSHYGSETAVLAPCDKELKLRQSVRPWMVQDGPDHDCWTRSLDGHSSPYDVLQSSTCVRDALGSVIPYPESFREAVEEHDYWCRRRREIEDVLGPDGFGDDGLDLVAATRAEVIRRLVEHEIATTNLTDLHARFALYRAHQSDNVEIEKALFRDLSTIVGLPGELPA